MSDLSRWLDAAYLTPGPKICFECCGRGWVVCALSGCGCETKTTCQRCDGTKVEG